MSTWSDAVASLQTTVNTLKTEVAELRDKCEDVEGRARRCGVRILGVPETAGSSSTTSISKLLRDVLQLDKHALIDCSHRSLAPRIPGGGEGGASKSCSTIARMSGLASCSQLVSVSLTVEKKSSSPTQKKRKKLHPRYRGA